MASDHGDTFAAAVVAAVVVVAGVVVVAAVAVVAVVDQCWLDADCCCPSADSSAVSLNIRTAAEVEAVAEC